MYLVVHVKRLCLSCGPCWEVMFILWSMLGGYVYLVVHVKRLCLSCGPC